MKTKISFEGNFYDSDDKRFMQLLTHVGSIAQANFEAKEVIIKILDEDLNDIERRRLTAILDILNVFDCE